MATTPIGFNAADQDADTKGAHGPTRPVVDFRSLGSSALRQFGGYIYDNCLKDLDGHRGLETYRLMGETDSTCGAILYTIDRLVRQLPWRVEHASSRPFDVEAGDFLESCMHDMEMSWHDFVSENFCGMLQYGHALVEIVYKRRAGDAPEYHLNSDYADGHIGWRNLASRAQDSIYRWVFDDNGRLLGAEQNAPPKYQPIYLPLDKCILFRTTSERGNPQGVSILRNAYKSYYTKRGLEGIESVGAERDVCGIPVVWLPQELLQAKEAGDTDAARLVQSYYDLVTNIRRDAQEGIVMPLAYDDSGNKMFDISLLSSAGSRQFDLDKIISRHAKDMGRSVMADFLFLGDVGGTGSYALHSDKTDIFLRALRTYVDTFVEALNKQAVRRLMKLNGFHMSEYPRLVAGSLDKVDATMLADTLVKLSQAGMTLFPDPELEKVVREASGLPEPPVHDEDESAIQPQRTVPSPNPTEMVDAPSPVPVPEQIHRDSLAEAAAGPAPVAKRATR